MEVALDEEMQISMAECRARAKLGTALNSQGRDVPLTEVDPKEVAKELQQLEALAEEARAGEGGWQVQLTLRASALKKLQAQLLDPGPAVEGSPIAPPPNIWEKTNFIDPHYEPLELTKEEAAAKAAAEEVAKAEEEVAFVKAVALAKKKGKPPPVRLEPPREWKPPEPRERWPGAPPHIRFGLLTVCEHPETGEHCSFGTHEPGCHGLLERFGVLPMHEVDPPPPAQPLAWRGPTTAETDIQAVSDVPIARGCPFAPVYDDVKYDLAQYGPLQREEGGMLEMFRVEAADKAVKAQRKQVKAWVGKNKADLEKDKKLQKELEEKELEVEALAKKRGKSKAEAVTELTKALKKVTKEYKAVRKIVIAAQKAKAKK